MSTFSTLDIRYREHCGRFDRITTDEGKCGLLNRDGDLIISVVYDWIENASREKDDLWLLGRGNVCGVFDINRRLFAVPLEFTRVSRFTDQFYFVERFGRFGVYDAQLIEFHIPLQEKDPVYNVLTQEFRLK